MPRDPYEKTYTNPRNISDPFISTSTPVHRRPSVNEHYHNNHYISVEDPNISGEGCFEENVYKNRRYSASGFNRNEKRNDRKL